MATSEDVARLAGVSKTTVSHVLNGTRPVSRKNKQRVLDAIRQLGYLPDLRARTLRRRTTECIGLVVSTLANPWYGALAQGVGIRAHEAGLSVITASHGDDPAREAVYLRQLQARRVDGVILAGSTGPAEIRLTQDLGVPVIFADNLPEGHLGQVVGIQNAAAAATAVRHLLVHDRHQRVAVVAGPKGMPTQDQRTAGFCEVLGHQQDVESGLVWRGPATIEAGRAGTLELLTHSNRPTALLATNNQLALGALQAFREAGLSCPRDVALIGWDDMPWEAVMTPPLTTVRQNPAEIGSRAVDLLLAISRGGELVTPTVPAQLILRASCSEACQASFHLRGYTALITPVQSVRSYTGIIMAGGFGTRLDPLTRFQAKPLLPLGNGKPVIELLIENLARAGVTDVLVTINREFRSHFQRWVKTARDVNVNITLVVEEVRSDQEKLGATAALAALIEHDRLPVGNDVIVLGGDNVFGSELTDLLKFFEELPESPVVGLADLQDPAKLAGKYGVAFLRPDSTIAELEEKPLSPKTTLASTACYVVPHMALAALPAFIRGGGSRDALGHFVSWLLTERPVRGFVFPAAEWADVGSIEDYAAAVRQFS